LSWTENFAPSSAYAIPANGLDATDGRLAPLRPLGPPPTYLRTHRPERARGGGGLSWSTTPRHGAAGPKLIWTRLQAQDIDRQATWVIVLLRVRCNRSNRPRCRAPAMKSRRHSISITSSARARMLACLTFIAQARWPHRGGFPRKAASGAARPPHGRRAACGR
jgi:hypothetical protein